MKNEHLESASSDSREAVQSTDAAARAELEQAVYLVARYVGIPGDRIHAWIEVMRMCGHDALAAYYPASPLIAWLDAYYVSGNDVPVERAAIRAEVWEKCKQFMREGKPLVHWKMEASIAADKRAERDALDAAASQESVETPIKHGEARSE